jgi:hypothetical protein
MKKFLSLVKSEATHIRNEKGEVNITAVLMMAIGVVFLAVGFIMLPIMTSAAETILDYAYTSCTSITDATYTGYTAVVGITPMLVLIGFLAAGVITGFMGIKMFKSGSTVSSNPGTLILLGLSIVFIAIALIVEPVMLDGVSSVYYNDGSGISSSFTGFSSLILVAPMLVHLGFLAAAVFTGFFGIKRLGTSG